MIKNFIKKILGIELLQQRQNILRCQLKYYKELEWANIYHDSIRGKEWLNNLSLNIGRWAGNYSFFYVLNRILNDCKPKEILEFGLGESSKFVSVFLDNYLLESNHNIIEQDKAWQSNFIEQFSLSHRSSIDILPLKKKKVKEYETYGYEKIEEYINKKYDLYIIDGPWGSPYYSRYDIVNIAGSFKPQDEFIIMLDDINRDGEKQTFEELKTVLNENNIKPNIGIYEGIKTVAVVATDKYKFISSL